MKNYILKKLLRALHELDMDELVKKTELEIKETEVKQLKNRVEELIGQMSALQKYLKVTIIPNWNPEKFKVQDFQREASSTTLGSAVIGGGK